MIEINEIWWKWFDRSKRGIIFLSIFYSKLYYRYFGYICTKENGVNVKFLLIDGDSDCCCSINIILWVSFFLTLSFPSSVFPDIMMWDILSVRNQFPGAFIIEKSGSMLHFTLSLTKMAWSLIPIPVPLNIINTVAPLDYKFLRTKETIKKMNSEQRLKTKLKWNPIGNL